MFAARENVKVTRFVTDENREDIQTVLAGSFEEAVRLTMDGRDCSTVLLEIVKD